MRNLKKVLALVLVLALSLTMFAGAIETVLPFDDVDDLTAEQQDALDLLYALGIFVGDGEGSVNPNDTLTRAELCAVLYRLQEGDSEGKYVSTYGTESTFEDVAADQWYTPYVNWAFIKGVVVGYGNGKFGPTDPVTGVQAATMLDRLLGYEVGSENWVLVASKYALDLGLDDGVESKDLFGTDLSRGDMMVMVANALNNKAVGSDKTLAEELYDLQIIEGAILLGAEKLGGSEFALFTFKNELDGNVISFASKYLSIDETPTIDEIGQKYVLYVAKAKDYNGYKLLYAAYEMDEDAYYGTKTGTVDDKALELADSTKANYVKFDDNAILYVNGKKVADKADAVRSTFAGIYGKKNNGTWKLIDNDGDGAYEYAFIQKLTFDMLGAKDIVANVVAFDNGKYTLSDGNTYDVGEYWVADKDGNATDGLVVVYDDVTKLIGEKSFTASNVQYKFWIEGEYIMKVEICDDTYFAGDYVLAMGPCGTSTYKGMQYVEFLTEDNTALYAYVSKVNHMDVKAGANWVDNSGWTYGAYVNELFYVNAYGDDTVELFTPGYINANPSSYFKDRAEGEVAVYEHEASSFVALSDRMATIEVKNVPQKFDPKKTYVVRRELVIRDWNELMDMIDDGVITLYEESYNGLNPIGDRFEDIDYFEYNLKSVDGDDLGSYILYGQLEDADDNTYEAIEDSFFDEIRNQNPRRWRWNNRNLLTLYYFQEVFTFDGKTFYGAQEDVNRVYVIDQPKMPGDTIAITFTFEPVATERFQIFKMYGTWYAQEYGEVYDAGEIRNLEWGKDYHIFFNGNEVIAKWVDNDRGRGRHVEFFFVDRFDTDGNRIRVGTGTTSAENIFFALRNMIWDSYNNPNNSVFNFFYDEAVALETSKGVVFAYGQYPYNFGQYGWRAYNFDEFDAESFGVGGMYDDAFALKFWDEMIFTTNVDGKIYVKAAKVTVAMNDVLPMGWMVENRVIFIAGEKFNDSYGMKADANGRYFSTIKPNGQADEVYLNYGYYFNYGDVVYAVVDEDNNILSVEKICNIFDVAKNVDLKESIFAGTGYSKDGTVTIQGVYGIKYTKTLDLNVTFFYNVDKHEFISSEAAAKLIADGSDFDVMFGGEGYNFMWIKK